MTKIYSESRYTMLHFIYCYTECHYAECHYAECGYAECHGAATVGLKVKLEKILKWQK